MDKIIDVFFLGYFDAINDALVSNLAKRFKLDINNNFKSILYDIAAVCISLYLFLKSSSSLFSLSVLNITKDATTNTEAIAITAISSIKVNPSFFILSPIMIIQ